MIDKNADHHLFLKISRIVIKPIASVRFPVTIKEIQGKILENHSITFSCDGLRFQEEFFSFAFIRRRKLPFTHADANSRLRDT